jgi:Transposase DDE domain group 1
LEGDRQAGQAAQGDGVPADGLAWAQLQAGEAGQQGRDGNLAVAEPKTLRYWLLHVAARVVRHSRRRILRVQRSWPWAVVLARAFARLRTLSLRC